MVSQANSLNSPLLLGHGCGKANFVKICRKLNKIATDNKAFRGGDQKNKEIYIGENIFFFGGGLLISFLYFFKFPSPGNSNPFCEGRGRVWVFLELHNARNMLLTIIYLLCPIVYFGHTVKISLFHLSGDYKKH